jgi:LmbE family N-acetylglucosaminyl deacetylase
MKSVPLLVSCLCLAGVVHVAAQPPSPLDAARRRVALEKLRVLGRALYVGAHPDDENTALLAYLASERKVGVAYLSLTRGDGGQNLIGTEQGEALGVIRTEELLAARAIDSAEQLFTRAVDFGFSKTAAETLRLWDREKVLADVVWAIRSFRPDVVITRFPENGDGGHGHHTASAILAHEAFMAAGDPRRFPEQLALVAPWQPKRLVWNTWRPPGEKRPEDATPLVSVDLGAYNAVLGRSYTEIAALSRSMHKSQGFGAPARRGPNLNYFEHVAGDAAVQDLFDGVDLSWRRVFGGERVDALLAQALAAASDDEPAAAVPDLLAALAALDGLPADPLLAGKREEILAAIRNAAGLWFEAITPEERVTPGSTHKIALAAANRSSVPLTLVRVEMAQAAVKTVNASLPNNAPVTQEIEVSLPQDAAPSQPYWLEEPPVHDTYAVTNARLIGQPRGPAALSARFVLRAGSQELVYNVPVEYRLVDPVEGDVYRDVVVAPAVTVDLGEAPLIFPDASPRTVKVRVRAHVVGAKGALRLSAPEGWRVTPERAPFTFTRQDEEAVLGFRVAPPRATSTGTLMASLDDGQAARSLSVISHPHIPQRTLLPHAQLTLVRVDLARPVRQIGYVMGAGDELPGILRQLGMNVTLLDDEALATHDLAGFEAIVVGVRAYNTRSALRESQARLLRYVEAGGTLVAQYDVDRGLVVDRLGPFDLKLSRERVTEEDAAVRMLEPAHPLLRSPHRIEPRDFEGWVQERGLYFASSWDKRYKALLAMHDAGEPDRTGGLLVAPYGKGAYIYTGLAFFRQLPAGVPGALRLFINLLAGGRHG